MTHKELLRQALTALTILDKKQVFIGLRTDITTLLAKPKCKRCQTNDLS